jgi:hypothetical protein
VVPLLTPKTPEALGGKGKAHADASIRYRHVDCDR